MRTILKMEYINSATKFINFLNKSPTPYHVVESSRRLLNDVGFTELKLTEPWDVKPLGKYFVTKNESTLIAFAVGGQYVQGNGFSIIGAHTDSPCLKLKLISKKTKCNYLQVGVECYGGGIWHTWFDKDLTIAGRVLLKGPNGQIQHKLIHVEKPILKIPNLAIHLNRETNDKFSPNKENHLVPILATTIGEQLLGGEKAPTEKSSGDKDEKSETKQCYEKHHSQLINLICEQLKCQREEIVDIELCVVDAQPATLGGINQEFIFGARLDNQVGAYAAIKSLVESCDESLGQDPCIRMSSVYDHEEVGSDSAQGAGSALTEHVLRRLSSPTTFEMAMAKSFMISADQAHAVHPNYSEYHEENHRPSLNGGVVLKYNGNQRYATNSVTASILKDACKIANVTVQDFLVKNDVACGSTIGPILSTKLGMSTVDIGMPQLSMHSIRETGSTVSILQYVNLMKAFFQNYARIRATYSSFM